MTRDEGRAQYDGWAEGERSAGTDYSSATGNDWEKKVGAGEEFVGGGGGSFVQQDELSQSGIWDGGGD